MKIKETLGKIARALFTWGKPLIKALIASKLKPMVKEAIGKGEGAVDKAIDDFVKKYL